MREATGRETMDASLDDSAVQEALPCYYDSRGGGRPIVRDVCLLGSGYETDVYALMLHSGNGADAARDRVVRIYPGCAMAAKAKHEFIAIRRLHEAGYRAPRALGLDIGDALGRPFVVLERMPGASLERVLVGFSRAARCRDADALTPHGAPAQPGRTVRVAGVAVMRLTVAIRGHRCGPCCAARPRREPGRRHTAIPT
jgi:hypothetical protein